MKILLLSTLLILSSCSIGGGVSDSVTEVRPASAVGSSGSTDPYQIGTVDTAFQLLGPDHKIEVGGVPDPKVSGITCFYSRAKTGGIKGWLGLAEDTSDASVACRQTGAITFVKPIALSEEIWNESTSFFFKKLRIVRFYDKSSNSLIYLVYSDRLIDGSPKNSISAVALESVQPTLVK
jgi:CreA protein